MEPALESPIRKWLGRCIGIATVGAAAMLLLIVIHETGTHPRTDDANVRANFIEIVAEVRPYGPIAGERQRTGQER